ncbi:MAG: hypothetical protein V9G98_22390 [Candidatus Competibacter sp.]
MPKPDADRIQTQGHLRPWYQPGGPAPNNKTYYGGQDGSYLSIGDTTDPLNGGISPINVQNPGAYKSFARVGREVAAPDFPTNSVEFMRTHGGIPRHLYDLGCVWNFYELAGKCKSPADFLQGWTDDVRIQSYGEATQVSEGGGAFDGDSGVIDSVDFTYQSVYTIGSLFFGEKAATEVDREVIDITYGNRVQCGQCGPNDDGTKLIYALLGTSGGTVAPSVVYSTNGGLTWTALAITGAAATDSPVSIDIVGQYLMVTVNTATDAGYFLAKINDLTGVPGTWTAKITSGFVSTFLVRDVYVATPRDVWFCALGGYVYKSESILQGVSVIDEADATTDDLLRIHGYGNTIVCGGESGRVIYSDNNGRSFGVTTTSPGAANLTALHVVGDSLWWVGNASGAVYWTDRKGAAAWTQLTLPSVSAGAIATIQDIRFATDEVGYIAAATAAPRAVLFHTYNGGQMWGGPELSRISQFPTLDRVNRLAYPDVADVTKTGVMSNNLAMAGLADNGTDGYIGLGIAGVTG